MTIDSARRQVASISYVLGFITGFVILMVEKDDKFIRFHAMQSLLSTLTLIVVNFVIGVLFSPLGIFSILSNFSGFIIWAMVVLFCVLGFIGAKHGKVYKLPFFGSFAERMVG